jgi:ATP-binding cassette, subfamily C, bacteriocin exporter
MPARGYEGLFVRQYDQSDCGVACLLSIIKYYGGENSREELRRLSGTTSTGTTLLGLYESAIRVGFEAAGYEADVDALIKHDLPCILHIVTKSNTQHYVVYFGIFERAGETKIIIGDPGRGIVYFTREELAQVWQSKSCLMLKPNKNFQKTKDINRSKRKWIKELLHQDFHILLIAAIIGLLISTLGLVMAVFSQRLIDDILPQKDFLKLNVGIVLIVLLLFVKEGLAVLRQYFLFRQSKDFNIRIVNSFYSHLLRLPRSFFDTRKIGELTARLNDTARIQRVVSQLAGSVIIDVLVAMVSTIVIFSYSSKTGIVCLIAIPVYFLLIYFHNKKIATGQRSIMSSYAVTQANYISTLQGIDVIKNSDKQGQFTATNRSIYRNYQQNIFSLGKIQLRLSFLANSFGIIFLMGILFFNSNQVLNDHLKTGELFAILGMCSSLLPSIANLAMVSIPISEAKIAFDRMFEFTGMNQENDGTGVDIKELTTFKGKDISFRFPGRPSIISNMTFEVSKGEIIAIMGENGCGKSTLTQLLLKNYLPESGIILVNENNLLPGISTASWRKIVNVVPQHIHIFSGTVLENIAFDDAAEKPEIVLRFLQQSGFLKFIDRLPQSYLTIVGEEGINLSGGQKQIIALARALYRQPQLLILDEVTAAMDRESEQFVLQLLERLKSKTAIVFITHRLHVLKTFCDRIYIMEKGNTTTQGNHQQLLETENLYSNYWKDLVS